MSLKNIKLLFREALSPEAIANIKAAQARRNGEIRKSALPSYVKQTSQIEDDPVSLGAYAKAPNVKSDIKAPKQDRIANDIPSLIKNIDTSLASIKQGLPDVQRILKSIDDTNHTDNLTRFLSDYDKLKLDAEESKKNASTNPSEENFRALRRTSDKVAKYFGNSFYKVKNSKPGQLGSNAWDYIDGPKPKIDTVAPKTDEPVKSVIAPVVSPKIDEPKPQSSSDWLKQNNMDDDDFDSELGLKSSDRHNDIDELDEVVLVENIRVKIKKLF